ncbi:hypothetical protein M0R45_026783 [Rubus argutus]|uniref:Uncharacterized protein n=1 Tax=Rubus argutus TaxID=59490 RepID=A0AAW1X083_RUBAR
MVHGEEEEIFFSPSQFICNGASKVDSQGVIAALNTTGPDLSDEGILLDEIRELLASLEHCSWNYVPRKYNAELWRPVSSLFLK